MDKAATTSIIIILLLLSITGATSGAEPLVLSVEKGDTLYSIGREYNVSVNTLIEANGILNPRQLKQGMDIEIPYTHVVERGDTLYSLAGTYGTTVNKLCQYNGISQDAVLRIGAVIRIPHEDESGYDSSTRIAESESDDTGDAGERAGLEENEGHSGEDPEKTVNDERKKPDAQSTAVRNARYEKGEKPVWPHAGERSELTGKLKGTQISGDKGDEIVAVASGKVIWVAPYRGYGKLVMIEAQNGMIYAYGGHEEIFVHVGDQVTAGAVIGTLGINPVEKNAKAFFFVYKNGRPVDPEKAPRG